MGSIIKRLNLSKRIAGSEDSLVWPAAILLLAGLTRLSRLTWYSLDVDEAFSLYWANTPLATLLAETLTLRGDPHPPLYYLLLQGGVGLLGENEIGMRLLSALAGILFTALLIRLGREMFSRQVGLAAGLLASVNPALVYSSLDARMYMLAALLFLAGALAFWRALRLGGKRRFAAAFLLLTLASYTHLGGILAIAALPFVVILAGRRRFWQGALTLAGVALIYLPYAINVWRVSATEGVVTRAAPGIGELLRFTLEWAIFHQTPAAGWLVWAAAGLAVVALVWGVVSNRYAPLSRAWLAFLLLLPLLLLVILSQRQALLQPKILVITSLAPLLLALALPARPWFILLLFLPQLWGYTALWQPQLQRENWRAAGHYLNAHAGPHDLTVAHLHFYEHPLRFYYEGEIVTPFGSHLNDAGEVERGLEPYLAQTEVLWLAQSGVEFTDPDRLLEQWLMERYPLITQQYPRHITLKGFLINPAGFPPLPGTTPLAVAFANGARLEGFWLAERRLPARDEWLHPPSNWLHVVLYATPGDYRLTLEDDPGNVWGGTLAHDGGAPLPAAPDQIVRLDFDLNLNPETPPGRYKIVLRAAGPDGPIPRADTGEDYLILDWVEIVAE